MCAYRRTLFNSIQFNSKTLFKDGDPVSFKTYLPWGPSKHENKYNHFSYKYTNQHRFIGQTQANTTYTFIQKYFHKHSYNVYTNMNIHHTLSVMHTNKQHLVNNAHVLAPFSLNALYIYTCFEHPLAL